MIFPSTFDLLTSRQPILNRNLLRIMTDFGRYRLSYEPPQNSAKFGYRIEPEVQMAISAEADLTQMCDFFESFLRASGYVFDGELEIVASDEALDNNYWKEKYVEMMQVAGGEGVGELVQDRDFWQEQTYKLLRPEE